MFDPITLAVGGGLVLSGWLAGRVSRRPTAPSDATMCSCGHGYGSHDGGCQAQVERPHYYSSGGRNGFEWVACACRAYAGPEPLPRAWTLLGVRVRPALVRRPHAHHLTPRVGWCKTLPFLPIAEARGFLGVLR